MPRTIAENIVRASLLIILFSSTILNAADKKPGRTFNDGAKELITKSQSIGD